MGYVELQILTIMKKEYTLEFPTQQSTATVTNLQVVKVAKVGTCAE